MLANPGCECRRVVGVYNRGIKKAPIKGLFTVRYLYVGCQ